VYLNAHFKQRHDVNTIVCFRERAASFFVFGLLAEVRHGTVDFGNFEASGRSKCRVSNGGF